MFEPTYPVSWHAILGDSVGNDEAVISGIGSHTVTAVPKDTGGAVTLQAIVIVYHHIFVLKPIIYSGENM